MARLGNAGDIVLHGCPREYQALIFAGNKRRVSESREGGASVFGG